MDITNKNRIHGTLFEQNITPISDAAIEVLHQLKQVLSELNENDFLQPIPMLHHATLSQHVRHVLEFFISLQKGWERGTVNYDQRQRSQELENSLPASLSKIEAIIEFIRIIPLQQSLLLVMNLPDEKTSTQIPTNFARELVYNLEHAIHHMAIIKIGLSVQCPYLKVPASFGVAKSTLKHQRQLRL